MPFNRPIYLDPKNTTMRVLVTGAAGLLGSHIVRSLLQNQHTPVCLVRHTTDLTTLRGVACDFVYGSIENYAEVTRAVQECDAVVHAASIYSHPSQEYSHFEQINVTGTINLVQAALKYDLKKFVYISTANTIGAGTKHKPGIELNEFDSFGLDSHYLNSKYIAEQYVLEQVEKGGLDAVVINPTFMIGSHDNFGKDDHLRPPEQDSFGSSRRQKFCPCEGCGQSHRPIPEFFQKRGKIFGGRPQLYV
jgi:dihydroflavonol-4-reductase